MTTQAEFRAWADGLHQAHPEMFGTGKARRLTARRKWHPVFLRVYGIRPWEMGRYDLHEEGLLLEDLKELKEHGLGF